MAFIFLDESGDLGFNSKKKNSKYFIVTILSAPTKTPIEKVVKQVHATLRKKVKRVSGGTLHAYKERPTTRSRLLKLLRNKDCSIMYIYLNKAKVYSHLREEKHILYNYVTNILLDRIMTKRLVNSTENISVVAAKRETNKFLNENFREYLERQISSRHKAKIKVNIATPSQEKSLQAVDFVSWSIFRKYEWEDDFYYNLIKSKIVEENALFP
ncbi:MAG: hypothetical protein G01um10145_210 [Microgenomates group bacterium Gr01-1014_5]|nr:MAG: hypothetical protein G01um10145_210 [Microgenomates group bacterium Gr01-1014_5]